MRLSTRLTIAMVAFVALTATAIGLLTYRNVESVIVPHGLDRISAHVHLLVTELDNDIRSARGDVLGFRSAAALDGIIRARLAGGNHPLDGTSEAAWRARMSSRYVAELTSKPNYLQFRIIGIDDDGREIVRVDRLGQDGAVRIAADTELQRKGDRDYFQQTIGLPAGQIYVSQIGLNRESDTIGMPRVPLLRVGTPVHAPDGRPFGIVIIDLDMRPIFARMRSSLDQGRQVYVVNDRGDYLVHPDPSREFGFEFGSPSRWQNDYPELVKALGSAEQGMSVVSSAAGDRIGAALGSARLASGPRVAIIETIPYSELIMPATAVRQSTLIAGFVAVLFAAVLAVFLARSLTKPLVQMTRAVERFVDDPSMAVRANASGEIGVLSRAFARMAADMRDKSVALTQEMEERRRLFETSLDLILITDRRGTFLRVSPSSRSILGYDPEEMVGHVGVEFIYPNDLDSVRTEMRLARRGKEMRNFESRYVHKHGRVVTLGWTGVWSEAEQKHFFFGRDMTERKRLEETERQVKETLAAVIDASPVAIICVATDRTVLVWSRAAEQIFGYTAADTLGQPYKLVPAGQEVEFDGLFERALAGETLRDVQVQRRRKDGSLVDISFDAAAMYDSDGVRGVAYALADITDRKKAEEALKYLAHYDQLTGLPNRLTLRSELHDLINLGVGSDRRPTSIAMFDLDGFKDINDTLGHSIGDQLLQEVAHRLRTIAEGTTRVYRLGGDEFVVIFPDCGDPRAVAKIVDGMLSRVAERFEINDQRLYIGASAGIAIAPADGSNVEDLISNADLALYDAKAAGGHTYRLFLPVLRARAQARRELDSELRRAFSENEFVLYFQPQLRLSDGAVVGAEALLRWQHPERGTLGPGAFIEALAESPVALEAGRWILQTACKKAAAWRAMGLPPVRIGVNLFPAQFHDGTLLRDVEVALLESALPAEALELEITENIALGHDEAMLGPLRALREKGVGLAFDDFGTGYASLSYLTRYPLSRIKIDQSFVRKIDDKSGSEDTAIVRSIIIMAHNLGLQVTAEGVETPAQAAFLQAQGCEEVQGFLYAKPLPVAEFEQFLRSRRIDTQDRAAGAFQSEKRGTWGKLVR